MGYHSHGISIKKKHGQHFLRDQFVLDAIVSQLPIEGRSVVEIGCGDGALTGEILRAHPERLWVFELDAEWATHVQKIYQQKSLQVFEQDACTITGAQLQGHAPWLLLANLPYNVTFPILQMLYRVRSYVPEGIIMVQEEVAQKILKTGGRGFGYPALFYQRYFVWNPLQKVPPSAFHPAPTVYSRLLQFTVQENVPDIPQEEGFWKFIRVCFAHPRRTLKNNLKQSHCTIEAIDSETLAKRAQQLGMPDFIAIWKQLIA